MTGEQEERTHTPGPWEVSGRFGTCIFSEGPEVARANVHALKGWGVERAQANARLIAAAPDLLAALQEWVGAFYNAGPNAVHDPVERVRLSEAAIAKATGGSP